MEDQAAGLRRLFARGGAPAHIAFAGAGGRAALIAGLARGLAGAGKEVVVVDERGGGDGIAAAFGIAPRFDLLQAANGDIAASRVLHRPEAAIRLVPAARAARACQGDDLAQRRRVAESLRRMQQGADYVLLDAAARGEGGGGDELSPLHPEAGRLVLVVAASGRGLTDAYARLKRLARGRDSRHGFEVIVSRAGSRAEAELLFGNLREVAQRHLGIVLELLGSLPQAGDPQEACDAMAEALLHPRRTARGGGRSGGIVLGKIPMALTAT